jgi:hypothetical protein
MEGTRHSDLDAGERQGLDLVGLDRREELNPWQGLDIQISMLATWWGST